MALIPLNTFKTKTAIIGAGTALTTATTVYTAPVGTTSIILMAQVSNLTTQTQEVSVVHYRNLPILADAQGNGAQSPGPSYLVRDFAIPANDAATVLSGKLIIETLDSLRVFSQTSSTLQLVLSILETAND